MVVHPQYPLAEPLRVQKSISGFRSDKHGALDHFHSYCGFPNLSLNQACALSAVIWGKSFDGLFESLNRTRFTGSRELFEFGPALFDGGSGPTSTVADRSVPRAPPG